MVHAHATLHHSCCTHKMDAFSTDSSGKRIDDEIHIHLLLNTSAANMTQGSVDIQVYTIYVYRVYAKCKI